MSQPCEKQRIYILLSENQRQIPDAYVPEVGEKTPLLISNYDTRSAAGFRIPNLISLTLNSRGNAPSSSDF